MKAEFINGHTDSYILVTENDYNEEFGFSQEKRIYELTNNGLTEFIRYVTNSIYDKYSEKQNNVYVLFGKGHKSDGKVVDEYWKQCEKNMKLDTSF